MSPKKKSTPKSSRKSSATRKQSRPRKSAPARKQSRAARKPARTKRPAQAKSQSKPQSKARSKPQAPRKAPAPARRAPTRTDKTPGNKSRLVESVIAEHRGLGSAAAGQSGDLEGFSRVADADSESVEELLEEGQSFEAGVVRGVERASDEEEREIVTDEVEEDDIPPEYGGSE
jgi:hypothetical protein